ncbi:MAG: anti-sigma factor family protein [Nitrospiria bacterium]
MDHEQFKQNLFELYDGELSATEHFEVLSHLKDCLECQQTYTNWEKIAKTFFRPPRPQTSELFVQRVMEQVDILSDSGWIKWRPVVVRWLAPTFGFGIAAFLLFIRLANQEPVISTEGLLLANGPEGIPSQWILLREAPQADDLVTMVLEEP